MLRVKPQLLLVCFIGMFAAVGTVLLFITLAAPRLSVEVENGSPTPPAAIINDGTASKGKAVRFATPTPTPSGNYPSQLLNLTNWKLTLPVETLHAGNPDEITQPELATFSISPYFVLNSAKTAVVFQANAGGATTGGSEYPRSELREMTSNGTAQASWSSSSGTHTMTIRQAITHLPVVKAHVVAGQIHDAQDDVIMIRLENKNLFVEGNGNELATLDSNYILGTVFDVRIEASGGRIRVFYNNVQKLDMAKSASGLYFKAGCYTQSNTSKGDAASAYGEVLIYQLAVSHT